VTNDGLELGNGQIAEIFQAGEPVPWRRGRRRNGGRRMSMNVIEASGLGKRYGGTWALRACSLAIPAGHVAALVGPNGAGKTTLLNLAVGLAAPSAGGVTVLGGLPAGSPEALDGIAFVAQDTPVYRTLSAADMLHLTRNLNRRFDQSYAQARLNELGIPLNRKAGRLSGGQQAQHAEGPPAPGTDPHRRRRGRPAGPPGRRRPGVSPGSPHPPG
jgi:ABC-type transport system involved in cytochrome bd biosynthesis fused ATPase/permease subunit